MTFMRPPTKNNIKKGPIGANEILSEKVFATNNTRDAGQGVPIRYCHAYEAFAAIRISIFFVNNKYEEKMKERKDEFFSQVQICMYILYSCTISLNK